MGKKGVVRVKQMGPRHAPPLVNPMEALLQPPSDEPIIQLPAQPDRSYKVYWPLHETFSMDASKFRCVYPSYLDATKTMKQGRRLPLALAVPNPTVADVSMALQVLQVRHVLQPYKGYSRDPSTLWDNPGRVLVDMSHHATKIHLLRQVAATIPNLPARAERLLREAAAQEEREKQKAEYLTSTIAKASSSAPSASSTKGNKKKGKHGKRK